MNFLYEPVFHKRWNKYILYDLATWTNGLAFRDFEFTHQGKPIIKIAELKHGISPETKYTTQNFALCYYITKGDMLFSWSGSPDTSIDIFWWRNIDGWLNQHTFKVEPNGMCDRIFFYYILKYLKPLFIEIARNKQTTGLGHVTIKDLKSMYVSLPPLPIQQRIAEILGALDDKIECNRRINETLEKMAMALYKHWFVDFGPFRDGEFEETELGMVPKGWESCKLASICDINEMSLKSGNKPEYIKYIDISSVTRGCVNEIKYMPLSIAPSRAQRIIRDGDTVWSMVRPNRMSYFLSLNPEINTIVSTGFAVISPRRVPFSWVYLTLTTKDFVEYLVSNSNGAAYPAVTSEVFEKAEVILPDEESLSIFHKKTESLLKSIDINYRENNILSQTRDYLLPKLLSGEIEVKAAEKQVSEVI